MYSYTYYYNRGWRPCRVGTKSLVTLAHGPLSLSVITVIKARQDIPELLTANLVFKLIHFITFDIDWS